MSIRTVNHDCIWNIIWNCGIYGIVKIGSIEGKLNGVSLCRRIYFQTKLMNKRYSSVMSSVLGIVTFNHPMDFNREQLSEETL